MRSKMKYIAALIFAAAASFAAAPTAPSVYPVVDGTITLQPGDIIAGQLLDPVAFAAESVGAKRHPLVRVGVTELRYGCRVVNGLPDFPGKVMKLHGEVLVVPVTAVMSSPAGYRALADMAFLGSDRLVGEVRDGRDNYSGILMQGMTVSGGGGGYTYITCPRSSDQKVPVPVLFVICTPAKIQVQVR